MNVELPKINHSEDFYIWFSPEKKEEYYSTPQYFYKSNYRIDYDNKLREIYWKETEKTEGGIKHPSTLFYPFHEKLGMFLLNFLNADLSTYESAYKDFFYMYGFEILRDIDEEYKVDLKSNLENDKNYLKATQEIYNALKEQILYIQENIKEAVHYIYNIDEIEELREFSYSERYAVYLIKNMGELYKYNKNDNIIRDSYANKRMEFSGISEIELLKLLKEKSMLISMNDTHKVNDIAGVCYAILETITQIPNYPIKRCQNCGMYFIPSKRLDEIYCDYPKKKGKTCREKGAISAYNKRLQDKSAYSEYRKLYQQKFAFMNKNKDDKKFKKDFENWKKLAKGKISDLKHGKLSEDDVYKWLEGNK